MGRIIAISSGDLNSTKYFNEYAIKMLGGTTKHVLFVGTASKDAKGYIENINKAFGELGCEVRALELVAKTYAAGEIKEMISWADIIYVGGGDTIFMMNTWRKYGVDTLLKDVYKKDTAVLMGISAGAICWFQCGCTDSELAVIPLDLTYGWANNMLNIHPYAFCPHYEDRVEELNILLEEKNIDGLALESNTAFVEENEKVYYIKSVEESKVFEFKYQDGKHIKREVHAEYAEKNKEEILE